jgi:hypothetical protein
VLLWWSSQVFSRQSSGRRLRTFPRSRRKTSQQNPEFTFWPVLTGASRNHNCSIDGVTSSEYFGIHFVSAYKLATLTFIFRCFTQSTSENMTIKI